MSKKNTNDVRYYEIVTRTLQKNYKNKPIVPETRKKLTKTMIFSRRKFIWKFDFLSRPQQISYGSIKSILFLFGDWPVRVMKCTPRIFGEEKLPSISLRKPFARVEGIPHVQALLHNSWRHLLELVAFRSIRGNTNMGDKKVVTNKVLLHFYSIVSEIVMLCAIKT